MQLVVVTDLLILHRLALVALEAVRVLLAVRYLAQLVMLVVIPQ
jgi:hypothetical protein